MGTGPSYRPDPFPGIFLCFSSGVFEFVESDLFQDNFSMALYSFGEVNDQCGVMSWAMQETGIVPFLSCDSNMTAWLKHKYKGSTVSGKEEEGRPGETKATGDSKDQLGIIYAHKWLLSRSRGLF